MDQYIFAFKMIYFTVVIIHPSVSLSLYFHYPFIQLHPHLQVVHLFYFCLVHTSIATFKFFEGQYHLENYNKFLLDNT